MIFHDKVFELKDPVRLDMDVSLATINKDTGTVTLGEVKKGMEITAMSFSEQIKNIIPADSNSSQEIFYKLPKPAPIDEITILDTEKEKQQKKETKKEKKSLNLITLLWISLAVIGGLAVFELYIALKRYHR